MRHGAVAVAAFVSKGFLCLSNDDFVFLVEGFGAVDIRYALCSGWKGVEGGGVFFLVLRLIVCIPGPGLGGRIGSIYIWAGWECICICICMV